MKCLSGKHDIGIGGVCLICLRLIRLGELVEKMEPGQRLIRSLNGETWKTWLMGDYGNMGLAFVSDNPVTALLGSRGEVEDI